jgi:hypothetical protein
MHRIHRTDSNQSNLIADLIACHFSVANTSMVGNGFPDLVIARNGRNLLVEVKVDGEDLLPGQKQFALEWKGPVIVAHSIVEVLHEYGRAFQRKPG